MIGAGAGLSTAAGFTYRGNALTNIFRTLRKNIIFPTCIPEDFITTIHWKNTGGIGAGTSM